LFDLKKKIYQASPGFVQRALGWVPYSLLAGRSYRKTAALAGRLEFAKPDVLDAFVETALADILRHAVENVPAYEHLRATVGRLSAFEALKAFPLIDKAAIRNDPVKYTARNVSSLASYAATTGGTTGTPLTFRLDSDSYGREMAAIHHQWQRVGYKTRHRKATFRGVRFRDAQAGVFWQQNPIHGELQFSPFHMSDNNLELYIQKLREFRPVFLHGYPSAIDSLAEFILRNQRQKDLPPIRAALLASQGCLCHERQRIEEAFHTRVYTHYGHSERLILAGECEQDLAYHLVPWYGVLEIIDDGQHCCSEPGQEGELVGTGLWNLSMPLIRYRTGDYGTRRESHCSCGRHWQRFDNIRGRANTEALITRSGTRIPAAIFGPDDTLFKNVKRYQFFQDRAGAFEVRLMVNPRFSPAELPRMESMFNQKVWGELDVSLKVVDDIPLTTAGKHKRVICTLLDESSGEALAPSPQEPAKGASHASCH